MRNVDRCARADAIGDECSAAEGSGDEGKASREVKNPIGAAATEAVSQHAGGVTFDQPTLTIAPSTQVGAGAEDTEDFMLAECDTGTAVVRRLIAEEMSSLRRPAWLLVRDNDRADDLVQDTILRVLTYAHQWQPGTNFGAWVRAIMRNHFYTEYGRRAREARLQIKGGPRSDAVLPSQFDRLVCNELSVAIDRLPKNQRAAVTLAVYEELTSEEIASRMRISPNAARCHLMRARKQLRNDPLPSGSRPAVPLPSATTVVRRPGSTV